MTYDVEIAGRTRRVDVERAGDRYTVTIDGHRHAADVTLINGVWSMILEPDPPGTGSRRSYEIAIEEHPPASGSLTVHVNGRPVPARVGVARGSWARSGHEAGGGARQNGPHLVTAPMPGRVVKVLVSRGDAVALRQGVLVVEAMKMENELRSPRAGTVADVKVSEGASVEAGAVLIVIE